MTETNPKGYREWTPINANKEIRVNSRSLAVGIFFAEEAQIDSLESKPFRRHCCEKMADAVKRKGNPKFEPRNPNKSKKQKHK